MSVEAVLLGFVNVLIYCAIIILIAFVVLWILNQAGFPPSAEVVKWGRILVALLCLAAILAWLLSLLGGWAYPGPFRFRP